MLAELGRGGMGAVFRARHVETGAEVALKVVLEGGSQDDINRFVREGQAVARLRHPGIVVVHEAGQLSGRPWLAMDLVEGETLRARLRRDGPLDAPTARRLFARLASALEHAHAQRVLHRDLKPDNIIIDLLGEARLIDFGLAQVTDRSRLTRTGDLLGTPTHMAPEQVLGDLAAVGPRTDVYGFGATLYEAITGQAPFSGSPMVVLDRVLKQAPPPPATVRPGVDPALAALCVVCLEKDPARRPSSAADLVRALSGRRAPRRRGRTRRARWIALPVTLLGVAGAVAALRRDPGATSDVPASVATSTPPAPPPPIEPPPPVEDPIAAFAARVEAMVGAGDRQGAIAALTEALEREPTRADLRSRRGVLRYEIGDGRGAEEDLEAALDAAPSTLGHVFRSAFRGTRGDIDGANADTLAAISLDPSSAEARYVRATLLDMTGDTPGARREVAEALRLAPDYVGALGLSAKIRIGAGDFRGALEDLDRALALSPDQSMMLSNRASVRAALDDFAGAVEDLMRVEKREGGLAFNEFVVLASALTRLERWEGAARAYAGALKTAPPEREELVGELRSESRQVARKLSNVAVEVNAQGDLARAIGLLTIAIELDPSCSEATYNRAHMQLEAGELREALADFDRTFALIDDVPTRLGRAAALVLLGEGARARDDLDVVIARGETAFDVVAMRAFARWLAGDFAGALADTDAACAAAPAEVGPLVTRADLRLSTGDAAGAERDADAAVTRLPGSVEALTFRARARGALGRAGEARADFDEACRRGPRNPMPFYFRALHRQDADPAGAAADLRHAADLPVSATPDLTYRAQARALTGDLSGSLADCEAVVAADARMVECLVLRARLRLHAGDVAGGRADLALGVSRTPAETDIGKLLREELAALGR